MKLDKKHFQALLIAGILLPGILLTAIRYAEIDRELNASAFARRQSIADLSAAVLGEKFSHLKDLAVSFATRVHFREMVARGEWVEAIGVFENVPQKDFDMIDRIFLTDPRGVLTADHPAAEGVRGKSFAGRDWYQAVRRSEKPIISEIYRRAAEPRINVVSVAAPIRAPDSDPEPGRVTGYLVMQIRLSTVLGWTRAMETGSAGTVYFADKNGHAAGWWPELLDDKDVSDRSETLPVSEALRGKRGAVFAKDPRDGQRHIVAFSPVLPDRWAAVVSQPAAEAFAMKTRILRSFWVFSLAFIALNLLLALLIVRLQNSLLRHQQARVQNEAERRQLELFAFVASHDLQEPLNKILAFGSILNETARPSMDAASAENLDRMLTAARRMSRMIEDVRNFSSIRQNAVWQKVDLNLTVREILEDLKDQVAAAGAQVLVQELPAVTGDPAQLKALFLNLVSNALKYRRPDRPLRVAVDPVRPSKDRIGVCVSDNGIGFDEKYREQIFTPFKRLHTRSEYEGTGLGLAICHRIMALHDGTITAHSGPQGGAAFTVLFPLTRI